MTTHSTVPTPLRVLVLTLNLLNTEIGITKRALRDVVPGYSDNFVAFERMLERDLVSLRETGLVIDVSGGPEPRYRINGSSFPAPDVRLTGAETELLIEAASAWNHLGPVDYTRLLSKLNSYTEEDASSEGSPVSHSLEGTEYVAQVLQAIEKRQPIQFTYASRRGVEIRDVAPWLLLVRGKAVYLRGFDLNRWEPRLYRLSRIRSGLQPIGEAAGYEIPEGIEPGFQQNVFLIRPILWIRNGQSELVRLRSGPPLQVNDYPPGLTARQGWDLCLGQEDDQSVWERMIFDNCVDVVPESPAHLRDKMVQQLQIASKWAVVSDGE